MKNQVVLAILFLRSIIKFDSKR